MTSEIGEMVANEVVTDSAFTTSTQERVVADVSGREEGIAFGAVTGASVESDGSAKTKAESGEIVVGR